QELYDLGRVGYGPMLEQGTYWLESQMGTNALGLAMITAMPTQVVGAEHFFESLHDLVTTAAPIHNQEGRLIGQVGMIGPVGRADARDLAFVTSTANAISNLLQTNQYFEDSNQHLTQVNAILETISEGVLMWDGLGRIQHCNSQVAKMFGVSSKHLSGKFIDQVVDFQPQIRLAIEQQDRIDQVETIVQVENRRISCLITLSPVQTGSSSSNDWMAILQPITQVRRLVQQQYGANAFFKMDDFVAQSVSMRKAIQQAQQAAKGTAPIILQGAGGSGKKRLAQAIHNMGARSKKPFVIVNCRAIPSELMLSEMLGTESEQTPDARPSRFELADSGTLVIEAIEDMPLELQEVLLNLFDIRHISRFGGSRMIPVNVRVICTTTADLSQRVKEKSFSDQLYYRLNAFRIEVPSLKQRVEDIPQIIRRFLGVRSEKLDKVIDIDPLAVEMLQRYPWPGNIRELENVLERALSHSETGTIVISDLPEGIRTGRVMTANDPDPKPIRSMKDAEREAIIRAGMACKGVVSRMAETLDIGRTTLWRKMRELDIHPEQFK
ncbi:MAG: sigma 54-interacting transcriptional regulator, partial [Chloroflexota bacterium]